MAVFVKFVDLFGMVWYVFVWPRSLLEVRAEPDNTRRMYGWLPTTGTLLVSLPHHTPKISGGKKDRKKLLCYYSRGERKDREGWGWKNWHSNPDDEDTQHEGGCTCNVVVAAVVTVVGMVWPKRQEARNTPLRIRNTTHDKYHGVEQSWVKNRYFPVYGPP